MTIAAVAAGQAIGGTGRRLAVPGAVVMTAGLIILWWGMGIFRGETGIGMAGSNVIPSGKRIVRGAFPKRETTPSTLGGGR